MASSATCVLVVDDDAQIGRFLQTNLRLAGYTVRVATTGAEGLYLAFETAPDLVLLDLGLPDMDGLEILRQLRRQLDTPVIIITARGDEDSMVDGLQLGADDYLVKPFGGRSLQARIEAVLRRYRAGLPPLDKREPLQFGPLLVDLAAREVALNDQPVRLSPTELNLLVELVRYPGRVRLHGDLLTAVWGAEYRDDITILRAAIYRLRQKIEPDPEAACLICTEPGVGYIFSKH